MNHISDFIQILLTVAAPLRWAACSFHCRLPALRRFLWRCMGFLYDFDNAF